MIKLLCLDLDGTLLNSEKEIPKKNKEAILYAVERGVKISLATGRSRQAILDIQKELEVKTDAICLNGGLILCDDKIIHTSYMDIDDENKIIDIAKKYQTQIYMTNEAGNMTVGKMSEGLKEQMQRGSLAGDYQFFDTYEEIKSQIQKTPIIKIAMQDFESENFEKIRIELQKISTISVERSDTYFLDMISKKSGKGEGAKILAKHLGIPMSEVMCIGDNENDMDMLEVAGISIAMGNADRKIKENADDITGSNDDCGVAEAIYRYI